MKYFLIAGEASGDLHASRLMSELLLRDPEAQFFFYGGDNMAAVGGTCLCHYRELAFMGFISVALHARTILRGLKRCKAEIARLRPDAVILVDYPGFNLRIARYVSKAGLCPVFYYIAPKIWAWKERRIRQIRQHITQLYSILPFEPEYFRWRHGYEVTYVGNPSLDEVTLFLGGNRLSDTDFGQLTGLAEAPFVALLPGSREQEIRDNLPRMLRAVKSLSPRPAPQQTESRKPATAGTAQGGELPPATLQIAICQASAVGRELYDRLLRAAGVEAKLVSGLTYDVLCRAQAALVTSGTATLETALLGAPQLVCYYLRGGAFIRGLKRLFLRVRYISLVNLIADAEVVPELIADRMNPRHVARLLKELLPGGTLRPAMLAGYADMRTRLGTPGAPGRAAADITARLRGQQPTAEEP